MAVRNWWISTTNDNNTERPQATGPRATTEGFTTTIQQRTDGEPTTALEIYGFAREDGTLRLEVLDHNGAIIHTFTTKR